MFQGPAYGGLVAWPTTGAIQANPAELIPENGLLVSQANALRDLLAQKHPLFGLGGLVVGHTQGLQTALDARATLQDLSSAISTREPAIQDGSLTIARTSGLQQALDERAKTAGLTSTWPSRPGSLF